MLHYRDNEKANLHAIWSCRNAISGKECWEHLI